MPRSALLFALLPLLALTQRAEAKTPEAFAVDSQGHLYAVDCPAAKFTKLGRIEVPAADGKGQPERPTLCDLAATPDGYLYGVSTSTLYLINIEDPTKSKKVGLHGLSNPYGMGGFGAALIANDLSGAVQSIHPKSAVSKKLGAMGGPWVASGDVATFQGRIYSSVKDAGRNEHLVSLDPQTGKAKLVGAFKDESGQAIDNVFGLIDHDKKLYALTSAGGFYEVDVKTARLTLIKSTGLAFWGASSYTRI